MKRNGIISFCTSILVIFSVVGCINSPCYRPGLSRFGGEMPGSVQCFDGSCDPCGSGTPDFTCEPCVPHGAVNCRSCLSNIGNGFCLIGRGILDVTAAPFIVVGKILSSGCRYEVIADCGNGMCGEIYYGDDCCQPMEFANPCTPSISSGCSTCANGYTEGIQFGGTVQNRIVAQNQMAVQNRAVVQNQPMQNRVVVQNQPMQNRVVVQNQPMQNRAVVQNQPMQNRAAVQSRTVPMLPQRNNTILQTSYQEQSTPTVRFVQPTK